VEVHGPNARARHVQVEATHEPDPMVDFQFPIFPISNCGPIGNRQLKIEKDRKSKIVHGPNAHAKADGSSP
jgi:hypothetical protein